MAKKLSDTINVNGTDYNVTAKTAETATTANKVAQSLILQEMHYKGDDSSGPSVTTTTKKFQGDTAQTVQYMSNQGGHFKGRVTAAPISETIKNNIDSNDNFKQTILNYQDIKELLFDQLFDQLLKNSVLYEWTADGKISSDLSDAGIVIVKGPDNKVGEFASENHVNKQDNNDTTNYFQTYLYIGIDTEGEIANIYFGTADHSIPFTVNVTAEEAVKATVAERLASTNYFITRLDSNDRASFNGSTEDSPTTTVGVTGTLPVKNGGTGKTTIQSATKNLFSYMNESKTTVDDTTKVLFRYATPSDSNGVFYYRDASYLFDYIKNRLKTSGSTNGILPAQYGGTGKNSLDLVTVGNATKATAVKTYYKAPDSAPADKEAETYPRITISPYTPKSTIGDGDIWIKVPKV